MKKIKKLLALIMSMAMVLGMSVTAFAADKQPSQNDAKEVTIEGINDNEATLKVYRIIEPKWDEDGTGFTGYKWAAGTTKAGQDVVINKVNGVDVVAGLDDDEVAKIAKDNENSFQPFTNGSQLKVGTWVVIATPKENVQITYNPMIVSVFYTVNGVEVGSINADTDSWDIDSKGAYKKSTDITDEVDKEVDTTDVNSEVGKIVHYTLSGVIPSYSDQYETQSLKYTLKDTIINGLEYTTDPITVTIGTEKETVNAENYEVTYYDKNNTETTDLTIATSFTVSFKSNYIKSLAVILTDADRTVYVKYGAKVTSDAIKDAGENKVELDYTRKPGEDVKGGEKTEYTYTYKFDGVVKKVDDTEKKNPLADATFELYYDKECTRKVDGIPGNPFTTDTDGNIKFEGLDGDLTYYLKETKAPNGYTLNEDVFEISFKNIDAKDGVINSYDVIVTNTRTNEKVANVTIGQNGQVSGVTGTIVNTKIGSLPSTGGIGTTIFTIGGCAIMIIAAGLFFASRRKSAK